MKRIFISWLMLLVLITGCSRFDSAEKIATPAPVVVVERTSEGQEQETAPEEAAESEAQTEELIINTEPERVPTRVKGIYVSEYVAGTTSMMDSLIEEIDKTEINAVVINLKGDEGYITCAMDSPLVTELGSVKVFIPDIEGLMKKLKEHGIYTIARVAAFRDPYMSEARPEWCVQNADGTVFKDNKGMAWINPYKQEAWDYLVEIAEEAKELGFDEVQFDYIRFCTERGMEQAVFDEADVQGRSRTDIITEFMEYTYGKLKEKGLWVSADVFGAIIDSGVNADSVGQIYGEMAKHMDYISPMIYPSHYSDGNFGIDHPDMHPYETISAALAASRKELYFAGLESDHIAEVRPWLQDFTASYLANYIEYGPQQIREQIQATYDAGYSEWMLWSAAVKYHWDGLLTPADAEGEYERLQESWAALPETTYAKETSAPETSAAADTADTVQSSAEESVQVSVESQAE